MKRPNPLDRPATLGVPARQVTSLAERAEGREPAESGLRDRTSAPTREAMRDRIRTNIVDNFSGHEFTGLAADTLSALGYICTVSMAGPHGGMDIQEFAQANAADLNGHLSAGTPRKHGPAYPMA